MVSIEMTSMFVSEVALALKFIGFCMMQEYYPRIEPETLILSRSRSSSCNDKKVSIEPSAMI